MNDQSLREQYPNRRFIIGIRISEWESLDKLASLEPWKYPGIDMVLVEGTERFEPVEGELVVEVNGKLVKSPFEGHRVWKQSRTFSFATTLHATELGVECVIGKSRVLLIEKGALNNDSILKEIEEANAASKLPLPPELKPEFKGNSLGNGQKRIKVADLIRDLGVTQQAINKRIKRLVADGWIDRAALPERNKTAYFDEATARIIKENPRGILKPNSEKIRAEYHNFYKL